MGKVLAACQDKAVTAAPGGAQGGAGTRAGLGRRHRRRQLVQRRDLDGWAGAPGWWTVVEGALTAESTPAKPCTACNYLVWQGGQPADFELTCDFKLSAAANSGVQIRSETRPTGIRTGTRRT